MNGLGGWEGVGPPSGNVRSLPGTLPRLLSSVFFLTTGPSGQLPLLLCELHSGG